MTCIHVECYAGVYIYLTNKSRHSNVSDIIDSRISESVCLVSEFLLLYLQKKKKYFVKCLLCAYRCTFFLRTISVIFNLVVSTSFKGLFFYINLFVNKKILPMLLSQLQFFLSIHLFNN